MNTLERKIFFENQEIELSFLKEKLLEQDAREPLKFEKEKEKYYYHTLCLESLLRVWLSGKITPYEYGGGDSTLPAGEKAVFCTGQNSEELMATFPIGAEFVIKIPATEAKKMQRGLFAVPHEEDNYTWYDIFEEFYLQNEVPLEKCKVLIGSLQQGSISHYSGDHRFNCPPGEKFQEFYNYFLMDNFDIVEGINLYEEEDKVKKFFEFVFSLEKIDLMSGRSNLDYQQNTYVLDFEEIKKRGIIPVFEDK
jgi:hypothetical protein